MTVKFASTFMAAVAIALCVAACGEGGDSTAMVDSAGARSTDPPTPGFHDGSGQTDIPAFGVEASASTRTDVENVLGAYLRAGGKGEWARACTYLLRTVSAELSELARRSTPNLGPGCAAMLPRVIKLSTRDRDPYFGTAQLSGFRIKEGAGAGFALFHGTDGNDYWVAMKVEGGKWKILS